MTRQHTGASTDACSTGSPVTERLRLPAKGMTHTEVLRAFDMLRRRIAMAACGTEGAFVGYDILKLATIPGTVHGEVEFSAVLTATYQTRHSVTYQAALHARSGDSGREEAILAQGTGQTVAVSRAG